MSPQRNFNGRGPQKVGFRPGQGQRGGKFFGSKPQGPHSGGKFFGNKPPGPHSGGKFFGNKPSGPQKKIQPKDEDSEDFSNESFDDSEASDLNETPDEGIDEQVVSKKANKRSLSFAKDVNTASSKKGPAQKTPMPKINAANGKPQLQNTPLGGQKNRQPIEAKKPVKGKPLDDDDDSEMGSEEIESFDDDMGSEEEEDSLMGVDEESEESGESNESDEVPEQKKKQEVEKAKAVEPKKKPDINNAAVHLKVCGVPKSVAPEKLSSFFASKGFKNVQVEYNTSAGCFFANVDSAQDASKMKSSLKGAEFSKGIKLSLLDYVQPAVKQSLPKQDNKKQEKAAKKKQDASDDDLSEGEEFDDEDMSDEEMSGDDEEVSNEDLDEMESFDEDDEESSASEKEVKATLKKANEAAKARAETVKASLETKEKKPAVESKEKSKPSVASGESKVAIRGVAKTYQPDKIKSFLESKGVTVKGAVAWDPQATGFVAVVPSTADLDKAQALRGSKLEKFSLSVTPYDGPKTPTTPQNAKEKQVPVSDSKLLSKPGKNETEGSKSASKVVEKKQEATPSVLQVSLKGIPKTFSVDEIGKFLQSKGVKPLGAIQYVQDATGFVLSLKSKGDLDVLKNLKGEKIGGKFRFSVADYSAKPSEPVKQPEAKKKPTKKEDSDEDDESLNLGSEESVSEEESSELGEEESLSDESEGEKEESESELQPKPKQSKKDEPAKPQPPVPAKKVTGDEKPLTLRLTGIPKATPTDKLQEFFKQRGAPSAVPKLQDNTLLVTVTSHFEYDKLKAMSGVRFNNFVMAIEEPKTPSKTVDNKTEKTSIPPGQLQFRARLLSIPSDFAVPKLTNLLKGRGVQTVVVTKENGQYIANCQTKPDFNRLLSLKGQRIDDNLRLMVAPIADQKPQQQKPQQPESRKRAADDSADNKKVSNDESVAPKKARQVDDSALQRRQLYVGNIPPKATDDDIRKCFSECVAVKVIRRPGAHKNFAFVSFDSEQTAEVVKNAKESSGGVKIQGERALIDFCGDKSSKFKELQAEKQKAELNPQAKQVVETKGPKPPQDSKQEVTGKKDKKENKEVVAAAASKSKLKSKESPSKPDAKVRFADDDLSEEDMSDDDDDDAEMDDEEMSGEEISFDEDGDDDGSEDQDDDDDDDDGDDDE